MSKSGLLYSFGSANDAGQLGLGDFKVRNTPTLIEKLRMTGEKIRSISCGFKHSICKNGLGKIFVWGSGDFGQLGLGNRKNQLIPTQIVLDKEITGGGAYKILQAISGFFFN